MGCTLATQRAGEDPCTLPPGPQACLSIRVLQRLAEATSCVSPFSFSKRLICARGLNTVTYHAGCPRLSLSPSSERCTNAAAHFLFWGS